LQGAVGGVKQGDAPQADVDENGFPIPDPDFDIDAQGPYDIWRDPYQWVELRKWRIDLPTAGKCFT